ncbi:MAG TPA: hypothetical protein DDY77_00770, partial [Clostridiales bacterium]|nr:hypothetical protein [Clostridiales bacterium]
MKKSKQKFSVFESANKHKALQFLILIGFVISLVAFFVLVPNCAEWLKVLLQIVSSLGVGVFTSAFISLLIEISNDYRDDRKKTEQREYLLLNIQSLLPILLCNEIRNLSGYIILFGDNKKMKKKATKESFYSLADSVKNYLEIIEKDYENENLTSFSGKGTCVIDEKWYERQKNKDKLFFYDMLPYYERLKACVTNIIDKKEFYLLNELFSKDDFDDLQELFYMIDDLIAYCRVRDFGSVIDIKENICVRLKKLGEFVFIDEKEVYKVT